MCCQGCFLSLSPLPGGTFSDFLSPSPHARGILLILPSLLIEMEPIEIEHGGEDFLVNVEGEEEGAEAPGRIDPLAIEAAGPLPPAEEPVRLRPLLIIRRQIRTMPQIGEEPVMAPVLPTNERELRRLRKTLRGTLDRRNHVANKVGHSEVDFLLSPREDDWRCLNCYRHAGPGWSVQHRHIVGQLRQLQSPACACGENPHEVTKVDACRDCTYLFLTHQHEIEEGRVFNCVRR